MLRQQGTQRDELVDLVARGHDGGAVAPYLGRLLDILGSRGHRSVRHGEKVASTSVAAKPPSVLSAANPPSCSPQGRLSRPLNRLVRSRGSIGLQRTTGCHRVPVRGPAKCHRLRGITLHALKLPSLCRGARRSKSNPTEAVRSRLKQRRYSRMFASVRKRSQMFSPHLCTIVPRLGLAVV